MGILSALKINLLTLVRDKMAFFWNTFFPLILATFFCIVMPNVGKSFESVNVGIDKNNPNITILKQIPHLNLKEVKEDVLTDLKNKEYKVYIEDDLSMKIVSSDSEVMIVKNILDQVKQLKETKINQVEIIKNMNKEFIENKNQSSSGVEMMLFSIVIMTSLYTMFDGVAYIDNILYGTSDFAIRMLASPLKKSIYLINGILSTLLVSGFNTLLLILYVKFVFGITLITNYLATFVTIIIIMFFGITMGMLLSVSIKSGTEKKTALGLGLILLMNYTSGMMGTGVTNIITTNFPIIKKINPTIYMENALLGVNIANDTNYLISMIQYIIPFSLILFGITLIYLRRHKYNDF
jgi:hypothetical protein